MLLVCILICILRLVRFWLMPDFVIDSFIVPIAFIFKEKEDVVIVTWLLGNPAPGACRLVIKHGGLMCSCACLFSEYLLPSRTCLV